MLSTAALLDLARANLDINRRWLDAMTPAGLAALDAPQGAFFSSNFGTWNHLLLTDRVWLGRFTGLAYPFGSLRERLCHTLEGLREERVATDEALLAEAARTDPAAPVELTWADGRRFRTPRWRGWLNMAAHQHHHRGQIHQMCHEVGIALPDGGLSGFYLRSGGYEPLD